MRYLFFLLVISISSVAHAQEYFWRAAAGAPSSSPMGACNNLADFLNASSPGAFNWEYKMNSVSKISDTRFMCNGERYTRQDHSGRQEYSTTADRGGDSCPPAAIFNSDTGECEAPPCPIGQIRDTMTGQCIAPPSECKSKLGKPHQMWVDTFNFEMCISGCSVAIENATPVKRLIGPGVSYDVDAVFTGDDCSGDTETTCSGECDISKPTESSTETECTSTTTDGEGRQVSNCQTTDIMKDNQDCVAKGGSLGSVNNMQTCVAANKGPKATQTVKDVKQTTESTPSGGTKTTTETTTTTTNCVGTKACTNTSTTVTNTSSTNANGTAGSGSSSCKGDNCGSGGKESTTPGKSEETEEEGVAGPTKTLGPKDSSGFGDTGKEWDDKIAAGREQLDGLIAQYSGLFSGAFDLNIGSGSGALPCLDRTISAMGETATIKICPADYEDQLVYLKYILLACAAILAGFIILRN